MDYEYTAPRPLKTTGVAAGTAIGFPHIMPSQAWGANDRLTMAHIGVGGMGGYHLKDMRGRMKKGEVNIAAGCDVDEKRLKNSSKVAGPQADVYRDCRYILERMDTDAVASAQPDHWHAVERVSG